MSMLLRRRGFLAGLLAAPAIIRTPGLLMPIKPLSFHHVFDIEPAFIIAADFVATETRIINAFLCNGPGEVLKLGSGVLTDHVVFNYGGTVTGRVKS